MRFDFMKEIQELKDRTTIRTEVKEFNEITAYNSALKIQKVWRGYSTRRKVQQRKLEEMLLIGKKLFIYCIL